MKRTMLARSIGAATGVIVLLGGCEQVTDPPSSPDGQRRSSGDLPSVQIDDNRFLNLDQRKARLSQQHAEFAGFYRRDDGELVVQVTDSEAVGAVLDAIRSTQSMQRLINRVPGISSRTVRYSFRKLYRAKQRLRSVLGSSGITGIDIEDDGNRIAVLIESGLRAAARKAVESASVDLRMVHFVSSGRPVPLDWLDDHHRPALGGLKVTATDSLNDNGASDTGHCTLGVPAMVGPDSTRGFLTASHCSPAGEGVCNDVQNDVVLAQPRAWNGTNLLRDSIIGSEYYEENAGGDDACEADAVFHKRLSGVTHKHSKLALGGNADAGEDWQDGSPDDTLNVDWDGSTHRFNAHEVSVVNGDPVEKIGQQTGWTAGDVDRDCVDTVVGATTVFCMNRVHQRSSNDTIVWHGDSGSASFLINSSIRHFAGILSACQDSVVPYGRCDGDAYWYSPHSQIQQAFNAWVDVDFGIGWDSNVDGPSYVRSYQQCLYTAEHDSQHSPFIYEWYRDGVLVATDTTTSTTNSERISTGNSDFDVMVEVTDDLGDTTGDLMSITVDPGGTSCGI